MNPLQDRSATEQAMEIAESRQPSPRQDTDDLVRTIKLYADKLREDGATRGDVKIIARALRELRYAFKVFTPYRDRRKVTIFGSARTPPDAPGYAQARELGQAIAECGWMVVTGAARGIMEAGHVGAGRADSMGLNILLPFESEANHIISGDEKLVHMKYFFTRKLMFVKECDAVVCLPGGFGTLDEAVEVLTLLQTGKRDMVPLVLLDEPGGEYWSAFDQFVRKQLLARGMINDEDLSLYMRTDSVAAAVRELVSFFRVYHSMRYVRSELVIRLNCALSDPFLERVNREYADILDGGSFYQREPFAEEEDEPLLARLPRLVCQFNRTNHGRLRQLIDLLNRKAAPGDAASKLLPR